MQRIIYPNANGGIAMIVPAPDCGLSIEAIALKDVPHGLPYKIVPTTSFPEDFTFFEAFEFDFTDNDGTGADYGAGSKTDVVGWNGDVPVLEVRG